MKIFVPLSGFGLPLAQRCAFILALAAVVAAPCLGTTVFTDSTFSLGSYTQTTFSSNTGPAGATVSFTQSAGSGNPAPSLNFHVDWTVNTTFSVFDGLINTGFSYNPGSAAITGIAFSQDRNTTFTAGTVVITNTSASLLLSQSGKFYVDSVTGAAFVAGTWQTTSASGLTAADFSLYDFTTGVLDATQHPDFSTAGGVIGFGTRIGLGHTNALGTGSYDALADNLSITVTTTPEPSSVWLVLTSLTGLAVWQCCTLRRRTRKHQT